MCCFVILLLSNEMQISVRRFSEILHLRAESKGNQYTLFAIYKDKKLEKLNKHHFQCFKKHWLQYSQT